MPTITHSDENELCLLLDESKIDTAGFPYIENSIQDFRYKNPMLKGVAYQLRRWPNDLFSSCMAACLVISGFVLLFFITAIFCSPVTSDDNCCELKLFEDDRLFNIYFVKEATQVWSKKEFCYIEAAAREQPDHKIYLINLMRTSYAPNMSEAHLKTALAAQNANIYVTDLPIDEFFSKSKLSSVAKNLSNGLLLMAARAYLLWNSPGVAMHPNAYCSLSTVNKCRWSNERKEDCTSTKSVAIDPTIDFQATEVHCQAFLGFLLQEISRNATQIYSLKDALDKFCPRIDNCPGVQVLDLKSRCLVDFFDCPTVYTTGNSW